MIDNFDLKKFLKESKALENLNPSLKAINENENYEKDAEADDAEHIEALEKDMKDDKKMSTKESLKSQIRERILAELDLDINKSADNSDYDFLPEGENGPAYRGSEGYDDASDSYTDEEDNYDYSNDFYDGDSNDFGDTDEFDGYGGYDIDEAKKKDEDVEDVETTDVETTDTTEEVPAEDAPAADGGLEDVAANMEGTEGDLMDHLMQAFKIAKGMNNEKLETQVGNTLKFFVSEYIGGSEQ
jgi:hypothetical protein